MLHLQLLPNLLLLALRGLILLRGAMGMRLGLGHGLATAPALADMLGLGRLVMHLSVDILHAAAILILVALLIFLQPDEPRDLPLQVLRQIFIEDVNF